MKSKAFHLTLIFSLLVPLTTSKAFIGFGLTAFQELASVDADLSQKIGNNVTSTLSRTAFENPYGIGGYLYLDFIPVIDLELDVQATIGQYKFNFTNTPAIGSPVSTGDVDFAYVRGSGYLTAVKKIIGLGIPVLGGVKVLAGGGMNYHITAPFASMDMMEEMLGDDLFDTTFDPTSMQDKIVNYMTDNTTTKTGVHFQTGIKFKILVLNAFLNYRYTIAKDVYPGQNGFSSLNLRLGMGF